MEAAVVGYAQGALKNTVGKLGSFLWNEALLVASVRADIQFIRDELQSMDGFLQDMIVSGHLNNQMKVWMLHVLEVACDAELCIDKFSNILGNRGGHGIVSYARRPVRFVRTVVPRYRIAKMIQMLKNRAKEVSERRSRYTTESKPHDTGPANNTTGRAAEAYSQLIRYNHLIAEDALVGIGSWAPDRLNPAPKPAVSSSSGQGNPAVPSSSGEANTQVTPSGYDCTVLVIVGPTGSGKTALAKMLYRRRYELYNQTMCAAWVTLPPKFDIKLVLKDILSQISNRRDSKIEGDDDDEELRKKVKKSLQEHSRFLIILDSLRSKDDWYSIKSALAHDGLDHGRVVVTIRSKDVANYCCSRIVELIHHPQPISKELHNTFADNLFFKRPWPSNFHHDEARPAVNYCCSVPLALKSVCGVLSGAGMDIRTINQFAIEVVAIMVQNIPTDDKVARVVKLCCNYLPSPLQQCSKDLSILPEGYIIKRKRLTRRWIAKGLISYIGGLNNEAVAESYFEELISRGVIEPETVCPTGKIKSCSINGVFKEYIPTLSNSANRPDIQQVPNPYSGSFQLYDFHPSDMLNYVRDKLPSTSPESLTVLDLEGCNGLRKQDLNDLCKFIQLKFLSLSNTDVTHIPRNIGKLTLLETLDIRQTKIQRVSKRILKLRNLKHLLAGCSYNPENNEDSTYHQHLFVNNVEVPAGMEELSALETLAHVNATEASKLLHVVHYLKNIRKLGLMITENKLNSRPLCISLMMMSASLLSLSICDERQGGSLDFLIFLCFPPQLLESLNLKGYLGKLPNWIADHKHLSKLTLSETRLSSDAISLLGKINSLLSLRLYPNSLKEHVLTLGKNEFPHLKLLVVHCNIIQVIRFEKGTASPSSTLSTSSTTEGEKGTASTFSTVSTSSTIEEEKGTASTSSTVSASSTTEEEKGTAPELEVFKWILSKNQMGKVEGIENLPMIKQVSLIGNANPIISHEINYAVKKHPNREKSLVFENIEREIREHTNAFENERHGIISKIAALPNHVKACFNGSC